MIHTQHFHIREVASYVNWLYFFHAWGFPATFGSITRVHGCQACWQQWAQSFPPAEQPRAQEAMRLFEDAHAMLNHLDQLGYMSHFRVALLQANSDGDDILLPDGIVLPLLRQQKCFDGPCLCLSDFIRPASQGIPDQVGLFVSTVDHEVEELFPDDSYRHLLCQTLADRLAEATAERGHQMVRREWWGYAPDEHLSIEELFQERYVGKRPAVGYPSLPDQSLNFILSDVLDFPSLGVSLTEHGAMMPHATTSGLILSHPASCHFSVGKIGHDQFLDYARRRGVSPEWLKPFLANLE